MKKIANQHFSSKFQQFQEINNSLIFYRLNTWQQRIIKEFFLCKCNHYIKGMTRETLHARPIFLNETHLHLLDSVRKKIDVTDRIPKTFEKSSNMPNIWHKMKKNHVPNCLKPIFRRISSLRITDQFFSEQTLPAFGLVLNDPAVISYKLKIFFVKTIVSTFWVFKWF